MALGLPGRALWGSIGWRMIIFAIGIKGYPFVLPIKLSGSLKITSAAEHLFVNRAVVTAHIVCASLPSLLHIAGCAR